jgi:hypothetical protein
MIHRNPFKLVVKLDSRLEGIPQYILADEDEEFMRIPDEIRDCCCFIYYSVAGVHKLAGTGFFIGEKYAEDGPEHLRWLDLVTAKHIIENVKKKAPMATLGMRVNVTGADAVDIDIPDAAWLYHPTDESVDAAIAHINNLQGLEVRALPTEMVMNDEIIKKHGIGIGDEVVITGLFYKHHGLKKNLPILRTGNIAMMPLEPAKTCYGPAEAYLIELRSIAGLSGSPIFVHTIFPKEGKLQHTLSWMGLMHGHWNLDNDSIDTVNNTDNEPLNVGIGIVVPAYKIMEITHQEIVMKMREEAKKLI